jgi:hypothetical protein
MGFMIVRLYQEVWFNETLEWTRGGCGRNVVVEGRPEKIAQSDAKRDFSPTCTCHVKALQ